MKTNAEIAGFYDAFSAHLAREVASGGANPRHEMIHKTLSRFTTPGGTALDLGCGVGITSYFLAAAWNMKVTAVDISPENIRIASENMAHTRIEYAYADAVTLSMGKTFDLICLCDILEHIPAHRRGAFLATIAAHSHEHTIIYLNVPDGRFQTHIQRFHPETLQIVDEALDFEEILEIFYALDFEPLEVHSRGLDTPAQYMEYVFVKRQMLEELYEVALKKYYPEAKC